MFCFSPYMRCIKQFAASVGTANKKPEHSLPARTQCPGVFSDVLIMKEFALSVDSLDGYSLIHFLLLPSWTAPEVHLATNLQGCVWLLQSKKGNRVFTLDHDTFVTDLLSITHKSRTGSLVLIRIPFVVQIPFHIHVPCFVRIPVIIHVPRLVLIKRVVPQHIESCLLIRIPVIRCIPS